MKILALFLSTSFACVRVANADLAFYAMGDVPYNSNEEDILGDHMGDLDEDDALFTVHLGDFNTPDVTRCTESHFENVADILKEGPLPTFVMAGDNDYLDCPNEDDAWGRYMDTMVGLEDEWDHDIDVNRKSGGSSSRPGGKELFSFFEDGILFVSTGVMRGESFAASEGWVRDQLDEYKDDSDFRGVVIFGHAEASSTLEDFMDDIEGVFNDLSVDVPVLYLCGDSHRYDTERSYNGWDQLDYVTVDKGGCAPPILVEVADENSSFSSGSKVFGGGLFRINRRGGRSSSCR